MYKMRVVLIVFWIAFTLGTERALADSSSTRDWDTCTAERIYDGDTITKARCAASGEIKIRLACIDTPEMNQAMGEDSRNRLRQILASTNNEFFVELVDEDAYQRKIGFVFVRLGENAQAINVNLTMVETGYALVYRKYCKKAVRHAKDQSFSGYLQAEERAKLGAKMHPDRVSIWDEEGRLKMATPEKWRRAAHPK